MMLPEEHQAEAERLLAQAKRGAQLLHDMGSQTVGNIQANQAALDQIVAMAHVHALLATG